VNAFLSVSLAGEGLVKTPLHFFSSVNIAYSGACEGCEGFRGVCSTTKNNRNNNRVNPSHPSLPLSSHFGRVRP
jgi:hypothetical protein